MIFLYLVAKNYPEYNDTVNAALEYAYKMRMNDLELRLSTYAEKIEKYVERE